jgi:hypothetical protein
LLHAAVIPDTCRHGAFAIHGHIEDAMLAQLLTGNIPLSHPEHMMLSPLAMLVRGPVLEGFSAKGDLRRVADGAQTWVEKREATTISVNSMDAPDLSSLPAVRRRKAPSRKTSTPDSSYQGVQPVIPEFALEFQEESAFVSATPRLALFVPEDDTRPLPVRVVERSACTLSWYSVESWHANVRRWVDRGSSAKADDAFDIARNMPWLSTAEDE